VGRAIGEDQVTTVELPVPLSADQIADLSSIQAEFAKVEVLAGDYHKRRALNFRAQWQFAASVGKLALEHHVEKGLGFNVSSVRGTGYTVCAMGVTGIDPYTVEGDERTTRHNRVQSVQQALDALFNLRDQHEGLTDDDFVAWYNAAGRLSGIYKNSRPIKQPKGDAEHDEAKVDAAIASIIGNPAAIEANVSLAPGAVTVFVAEGMGNKARLVRMDVTPDFIASMASKAPDPMERATESLVFFRQLLLSTARILPDAMSGEPVSPLKAGEKLSASTKMKPANAVVLVKDGVFSVASSRKLDTIVMEVESGEDLRVPDGFIDNVTRGTMTARLESSLDAAGFIKPQDDPNSPVGIHYSATGDQITFTNCKAAKSGQLLIKELDRMGSVWTHRVRSFKGGVEAELDDKLRVSFAGFVSSVMKKRDSHPIAVEVKDGALLLRHGTAAPVTIKCPAQGEATAWVKQDDFRRAMAGLLDLPLVDDIAVGIDSRGLVRFIAQTEAANFRVYLQTLREGDGDKQTLERGLLERVQSSDDRVELLAA
jgi:hypothetical protein